MIFNLPNALTLFRIFLVPLLVVVLLTPPWTTAWVKLQVQETTSLQWLVDLSAWLSTWRELVAVAIFLVADLVGVCWNAVAIKKEVLTIIAIATNGIKFAPKK